MVKQPIGYKDRGGIKLAVKFKPEVFQRLKNRAIEHDQYFSDIVNDAIECGLLAIEEQESDEAVHVKVQLRAVV